MDADGRRRSVTVTTPNTLRFGATVFFESVRITSELPVWRETSLSVDGSSASRT